jgi:predicted Rossmann fold nucleotide-binding protein DprA/Smf involved in DNA uptake
MRLAVVGSRTWSDYALLCRELDSIGPSNIVSGGARGADSFAEAYAVSRKLPFIKFLPDWKRDGRGAGFRRNTYIVDAADKVIVFWDGKSRGAAHTMGLARKAGKLLRVVQVEEPRHD